MSRHYIYVGLTLTIVFWGASFVATKVALRELTPATITFVRFGIGMLVLLVVVMKRRDFRSASLRQLPYFALLGFLGTTFHQWLQATGLQTATATVTSWIVATIPVFVALLGWALLGEQLSRRRISGIVLAIAGVVIVVSGGRPLALIAGRVGTMGDILVAISALNWAVFTVLSKSFLGSHRPDKPGERGELGRSVGSMLYIMGFGWVYSMVWLAFDGGWGSLADLSWPGWWALFFLGVACSGLAYLFWYAALNVVDATQAGVFLYFQPLVTVALAGPMLGEAHTSATLLGGLAILLGVWLVNKS
jgi:drug/metabolite transporter (DMT)-like permease